MFITRFDPQQATDRDWYALNTFNNRARALSWPEDLPMPVEKTRLDLTTIAPMTTVHKWVAWDGDQIIGTGEVWTEKGESNQHIAWTHLVVLPEWRQQGLGSQLLALMADAARQRGRRLLMGETDADDPAGAVFASQMNATAGLSAYTNQLDLAEVDRDLVQRWLDRAAERSQGVELGFMTGSYPVDMLPRIIKMFDGAANDEPRGSLDLEDEKVTPEQMQAWDQSREARKVERWFYYVRDTATGDLVGYSQVFWNPFEPDRLWQGGTGVWRDYRNRGLGRWMKAAMLDKIFRERPYVKRIRTGNADSNAPMLKINNELGFRPRKTWTTWQVEIDKLPALVMPEVAEPELAFA
jgi:mycothiol synthase